MNIRRFQSESGVALVEFALVVPVLVFMLLGILDVARAVNAYVTISNAAREGAHYAVLHPTAAPSAIVAAVRGRVVPLDTSAVTVIVSYHDGTSFVPWPSGGIPASSPTPSYVPTQVSVSYPWSAVTMLIGGFFSGTPFSASSTMEALR